MCVYCTSLLLLFLVSLFFLSTDDDDKPNAEPPRDYLVTFKTKLCELVKILADVYPPTGSYRINEKLTSMGQIPLFVSVILDFSPYGIRCQLN